MVIASLNIIMLCDRIKLINDTVIELEDLASYSKEDFLKDWRNPAATESYLRHCLEAIFDIGRHLLARIAGCKMMEYKAIGRELAKKEIVSPLLSAKLVKMAGYRNRIVHLYHEITSEELYKIIRNNLDDIREFVKAIALFIESYQKGMNADAD